MKSLLSLNFFNSEVASKNIQKHAEKEQLSIYDSSFYLLLQASDAFFSLIK